MTLVFLHHFGGSGRTWTEVISLLKSEHRCVAPDLPGFGDALPGGPTMDDAADAVTLVLPLAGERFVLVGHSMGGKIALALAARRPAGLAGLVLLAPSPPTPEPITNVSRAELLTAVLGDQVAAAKIVGEVSVRPLSPAISARTVADTAHTSREAWRAWLETGSRENIAGRMDQIAVPALVVSGAADPVLPTDLIAREVVACLPSARLTVVPNVGHLLPLEAPSEVAALIKEAIATF